jgi:hypothetical protein
MVEITVTEIFCHKTPNCGVFMSEGTIDAEK